jgi:hypothetical protein
MHDVLAHSRDNYAGALPAGDGEVWNSKQTFRSDVWLNAFTGYIWLGGAERGIAWFAENDKGWITAKNHDEPLMSITRTDGRVTLRVDLVNVPGVIDKPTELVFGLQASPTKPVPRDYRTKARTLPSVGLSVHPWGGLSCAWKSPYMDDWRVVDKVIEGRNQGRVDREWFEAFHTKHNVPPVHGQKSWLSDVLRFASRTKPLTHPDPVYFEEMHVLPFIPEYRVYQDEWNLGRSAEKTTATIDIYRNSGGRNVNPGVHVNFGPSYQDYALYQMNEWLKRGVSIYWDNTYLRTSTNPWTSAAYETTDGRIQPGQTLWNQRRYMKRTWNLMNHWRRRGVPRPLEFVCHMTNDLQLPLFTWATCVYDIELSQSYYASNFPDACEPGRPFAPEFLLTESTGLQVGAYPYLVHGLFQCTLPGEALGPAPGPIEASRREWGLRTVHEIISGGPQSHGLPAGTLSKALYAFGYGTEAARVWNYWDDRPAFRVSDDRVKALLVTRNDDRRMLLVLQSWRRGPAAPKITFLPERVGFPAGLHAYEAVRDRRLRLEGQALTVPLDFPYEAAVLLIGDEAPSADVVFADNFNAGLNPGWDYLSHYATVRDGALRFGRNEAPWRNRPRMFRWLDLPRFTDAELSFRFRIEKLPAGKTELFTVRFPAEGVAWSKHGLSHSDVAGGVALHATRDPASGLTWYPVTRRKGKYRTLARGVTPDPGTEYHAVRITLSSEGRYVVTVDGKPVIDVPDSGVKAGRAFGISAADRPERNIGALLLDDIVLRAGRTDRTALDEQYRKARATSAEILAGETDALRESIYSAFSARHEANGIYKLALFRRPVTDAATLRRRFTTASTRQRRVLLSLLARLRERRKAHEDAMTAIGQPADRVPQFEKARAETVAFLETQLTQAPAGLKKDIRQALDALPEGGAPRKPGRPQGNP